MPDVGAVILAAGRSRRLGHDKARVELDGAPILTRLVDVYAAARIAPVVAVISEAVEDLVPPTARAVRSDPDREMIDSLIVGLQALEGVAGAIVQPVDAPFTDRAMIEALLSGAADRYRVLVHATKPGHPVYVPVSRFDEVFARPEGGLRTLLAHDQESIEWNDDRILADLDRPDDLRYWLPRS